MKIYKITEASKILDFAGAIEKAVLFDGVVEPQRENAELQELLKDRARLDWLADANQSIGNVTLPRDIVERNLSSLRDAIDEAMKT